MSVAPSCHVGAASAPTCGKGRELGATDHGTEACYLGAVAYGADPQDPETQFVSPGVAKRVRKQKIRSIALF